MLNDFALETLSLGEAALSPNNMFPTRSINILQGSVVAPN